MWIFVLDFRSPLTQHSWIEKCLEKTELNYKTVFSYNACDWLKKQTKSHHYMKIEPEPAGEATLLVSRARDYNLPEIIVPCLGGAAGGRENAVGKIAKLRFTNAFSRICDWLIVALAFQKLLNLPGCG